MVILSFQILIIFTIYLASIFGKKSLVIVCAAWTVFTLANAFMPGLILLQLITIWACYWLLKRKKNTAVEPHPILPAGEKPSASNSSPQPPALALEPAVLTPAKSAPAGGAFLRSLDSLNTVITSFSDSVSLNLDVQKATASLEAVIFTEKLWTEKALERAQSALKLDAWRQEHGEKAWAHYQQAHAQFTKALESSTTVAVTAPSPVWAIPDFSCVLVAGAPSGDRLEAKKRQLQHERDTFFSDIVQQVWSNVPLRTALRDELCKLGDMTPGTAFPAKLRRATNRWRGLRSGPCWARFRHQVLASRSRRHRVAGSPHTFPDSCASKSWRHGCAPLNCPI